MILQVSSLELNGFYDNYTSYAKKGPNKLQWAITTLKDGLKSMLGNNGATPNKNQFIL